MNDQPSVSPALMYCAQRAAASRLADFCVQLNLNSCMIKGELNYKISKASWN